MANDHIMRINVYDTTLEVRGSHDCLTRIAGRWKKWQKADGDRNAVLTAKGFTYNSPQRPTTLMVGMIHIYAIEVYPAMTA